MARNPVQFQKGISLNEFLSLYGTEDQCFDALYRRAPRERRIAPAGFDSGKAGGARYRADAKARTDR